MTTSNTLVTREGGAVIESATPSVRPAAPTNNVTDLLKQRVDATPQRILFSVPDAAHSSSWRNITASEFARDVNAIAKGLIAEGVQPGDRIAFMGLTSYEWTLVDFAIWTAGAVMVPVYETSSPKQLE